MVGFIYLTTNIITGKKYIGKRQLSWDTHNINNYLGSSRLLKEDINYYGVDNFTREILDYANTKVELAELEIQYLRQYSVVKSDDFYNLAIPRLSWSEGWEQRKEDPDVTKRRADKMRGVKRNKYNMRVEFRCISDEMKAQIIALHNSGATPWDIHKQTDFHCVGIKKFLVKNELKPHKRKCWQNKWTKEEELEIKELYVQGLSCKQISIKTGRNISIISSKLKELGVELRDANYYKAHGTSIQ